MQIFQKPLNMGDYLKLGGVAWYKQYYPIGLYNMDD